MSDQGFFDSIDMSDDVETIVSLIEGIYDPQDIAQVILSSHYLRQLLDTAYGAGVKDGLEASSD